LPKKRLHLWAALLSAFEMDDEGAYLSQMRQAAAPRNNRFIFEEKPWRLCSRSTTDWSVTQLSWMARRLPSNE
jgi:hypothetical protein